jgi:hypothetical protein
VHSLISSISKNDSVNEFFENHTADILTLALDLIEKNEFSQIMVGFSILESLIENSPQEILQYEESFLSLILKYLSIDSPFIFGSVCDV